jgi:hypothetical protein
VSWQWGRVTLWGGGGGGTLVGGGTLIAQKQKKDNTLAKKNLKNVTLAISHGPVRAFHLIVHCLHVVAHFIKHAESLGDACRARARQSEGSEFKWREGPRLRGRQGGREAILRLY